MSTQMQVFDRQVKLLQRSSAARASDASEYDYLRDIAAERIVDRLGDISRDFGEVLDIGCHSGHILKALRASGMEGKVGHLTQCDPSEDMLLRAGKDDDDDDDCSEAAASQSRWPATRQLLADEEQLPLDELPLEAYDLVTSSMSLHWVNDLPGALVQARERLRPDGAFVGCMLGGETLNELRTALLVAEQERDGGVSPHVSPLAQVSDVGNLMTRCGFTMPTVDSDKVEVEFDNAFELMRHLQGMGEANAVLSRRPHTGRDVLLAAAAIYQEMYGSPVDGSVPATFEIISMIGWKPDESQASPERRGSATASLKDLTSMVTRVDPSNTTSPSS